MAICHFALQSISRGAGRSAIAAAAYRSGTTITDDRTGKRHNYDFRARIGDVSAADTGILVPAGVDAAWALDRSRLWNAAERAERRRDSRVATEIVLALPHELFREDRAALAAQFGQLLANRYSVAVDYAIHKPNKAGDDRNHHVHLLLTTRKLTPTGLGERSDFELNEETRKARGLLRRAAEIRNLREEWARMANRFLERAGIEARLDARSYVDRGIPVVPPAKRGPAVTGLQRRHVGTDVLSISPEAEALNAQLIRDDPTSLLRLVADTQSVFTRQDIAMALNRYVSDHEQFQICLEAAMASPELLPLPSRPERSKVTLPGGRIVDLPAKFTLKSTAELEWKLLNDALELADTSSSPLKADTTSVATATLTKRDGIELSPAQLASLQHIAGPSALTALVGVAGAGKSTLLKAARIAWEREGFRVFGAAIAGKAAQALGESSGIRSRTIVSLLLFWEKGTDRLTARDVLVIDEAGMVDSKTLGRLLAETRRAGAKIVLVGDPEQLPAIGAGAPFRALIERIGASQLLEVRRQKEEWQRQATVDFSQGRIVEALNGYVAHGNVRLEADPIASAIQLYLDSARLPGTQASLAHSNAGVRALNNGIRDRLKLSGALNPAAGGRYETRAGEREFLQSDRVILTRNAMLPSADGRGQLEIRNGQLGTIVRCDTGNLLVKLDGNDKTVSIPITRYNDLDHGYALTVHKTQGATVDRAYVVESPGMDRNLLYVAMSRHRDSCILLANQAHHADLAKLVETLSRRHNVKETTLDYLEPTLAAAELAWISAESVWRRPSDVGRLKKLLASAEYEARQEAFGRTPDQILELAARYRPPPIGQVLAQDSQLAALDRQLEASRRGREDLDATARLTKARDLRERHVHADYEKRWRPNLARITALMRQHDTALRHRQVAAAAMPALLAWKPQPPPAFKRAEWLLADRILQLTKSYDQAQQTLCDTLARRQPALFDLTHELSPYLAETRSAETPAPLAPLFHPPLIFRSRRRLRPARAFLPAELERALQRFRAALAAGITQSPRRDTRRQAAAHASYEQAHQERQAARRAPQAADTPEERAYQTRGYIDFGRDRPRIAKNMTSTLQALQTAAPHIWGDTEPGRALQAAYKALGLYHEGRLTNGHLKDALNSLILVNPQSFIGAVPNQAEGERQQTALLWQGVVDRARALIEEMRVVDAQRRDRASIVRREPPTMPR